MEPSFVSAIQELVNGVRLVLKGEFQLLKAEAGESARFVGKQGIVLGIAAGIGLLGVLCGIAFILIGLGRLLGDNYWLSALILSAVFLGTATVVALHSVGKVREFDYRMRPVSDSLRSEQEMITHNVRDIRSSARASVNQAVRGARGRHEP